MPFSLPRLCISAEHLPNQLLHSSAPLNRHYKALPLDLLGSLAVIGERLKNVARRHSRLPPKVLQDDRSNLFLSKCSSLQFKKGTPEHFFSHVALKLSDALVATLQLPKHLFDQNHVDGSLHAMAKLTFTHELAGFDRHSVLLQLLGMLQGDTLLEAVPSRERLRDQPVRKVPVRYSQSITALLAILKAPVPLKEYLLRRLHLVL